MIAVPDATTLPIDGRPMRASNFSINSCGKPSGNVGNARSSTTPINSQCPVTESLPADRSAMPSERGGRRGRRRVRERDEARQAHGGERRDVQGNGGRDVAERVAALVLVQRGIGQLADADAVEDDDDGAREHAVRDGVTRNSSERCAACESSRSRA